ncbi:hypothetical protein BSL78_07688 [Apostichopus japonicus]|uniref:Ig-like domain-containing protein n=1 Tax=Stichopus japonicus TaxID=307972 RepID=A0A2G8L578_STIJA|nr:hypothetical protein BSL78_07688 [Apostichopus japonicus]
MFIISVPATVTLTLNGQGYLSGRLSFVKGETLVAICHASGGCPPVEITWMMNNRSTELTTHDVSSIETPNANDETFGVTSTLILEMKEEAIGTISCVVSHSCHFPDQKSIAHYVIVGFTTWKFRMQNIYIPISLTFFVIVQCGLLVLMKRNRGD